MYAGTTQKHPGLALIGRAYKAAISKSGKAHLAAVPHPQPNFSAPLLAIGDCYLRSFLQAAMMLGGLNKVDSRSRSLGGGGDYTRSQGSRMKMQISRLERELLAQPPPTAA
ncbi:uncharacterized protein H6S33_008710 [Morchella sextelata]|uniref:uncharacterized protein n=1 Tax=Morchella sextelata TaxID=1174677 RepID=UPI001D05AB82|nr:uncharacterized protein H6S33_008710 [Morchella sextelata]KAH0602371.1 hypothetical protein H6S33_008710 [Morchella sextelata]